MRKKITLNEFISKSILVHGDGTYDYSKIINFDYNELMEIVCKEHGSFFQKPKLHCIGRGCQKCGLLKRAKKRTSLQEDILDKIIKMHGDELDCSKFLYSGVKSKAIFVCKTHGGFEKNVMDVLSGQGCPRCGHNSGGKKIELDFNYFIEKSMAAHGNKYEYIVETYTRMSDKMEILCKTHGLFLQQASRHASGKGCPECGKEESRQKRSYSKEQFLYLVNNIFGDKYDLSKIIYKDYNSKIEIVCGIHGSFWKKPNEFINRKQGCPKCSMENLSKKMLLTTDDFILMAQAVHGDLYCYSKSKYLGNNINIEIECKLHGSFFQLPSNHISRKCGCPKCKLILSRGEKKIISFLTKININFKQQKRFVDCKDKYTLPFDFYIPEQNACIEYDGEQHFFGWSFNSKKNYKNNLDKIQYHDQIKNKFCEENRIGLLRIPYYDFDKIEEKIFEFLSVNKKEYIVREVLYSE